MSLASGTHLFSVPSGSRSVRYDRPIRLGNPELCLLVSFFGLAEHQLDHGTIEFRFVTRHSATNQFLQGPYLMDRRKPCLRTTCLSSPGSALVAPSELLSTARPVAHGLDFTKWRVSNDRVTRLQTPSPEQPFSHFPGGSQHRRTSGSSRHRFRLHEHAIAFTRRTYSFQHSRSCGFLDTYVFRVMFYSVPYTYGQSCIRFSSLRNTPMHPVVPVPDSLLLCSRALTTTPEHFAYIPTPYITDHKFFRLSPPNT